MGKYEVSGELINKVQILLRKESGLPSFNPSDHPPPPPSILQDAIAAVGSNSGDSLLCDGCNGELLRGSDSIICIFCGRFPRNLPDCPSPPPPISFTSTVGSQWFLRSLALDGSESIERPIEGDSESGRARSIVSNEIPLSTLLDMQLKWSDESNRFGEKNETGKQSAKLVGLDFDELFQTEQSKEGPPNSSYEPVVVSKKFESKEDTSFSGQSSLSLFENTQTGSDEGAIDESDWAAEFQSANADAKVDSGFHMDSIQRPLAEEDSANVATSQAFSTSAIESKSEPHFDFQQSERNILVQDGEKGLEMVDPSFDWLPAADKQKMSDEVVSPNDYKLDGVGGPFDSWDEFRTFSSAENNQNEPTSISLRGTESSSGFDISDSWNEFAGSVGSGQTQRQESLGVDKPVHGEADDFALWGHAGVKQNDIHVESSPNKANDQGGTLGLWGGASNEVDDSFDFWNDFKTSAAGDNNQQQSNKEETAGGEVSAAGGTIMVQNSTAGHSHPEHDVGRSEALGDSLILGNDNSLDLWSDFAMSTGILDSKPVSNETSSGALSDFSSLTVNDSIPAQSSATKTLENQTSMQKDDDFGSWSDFRSSLKRPDNNFPGSKVYGSSQDQTIPVPEKQSTATDNDPHNSWNDFDWSTSILEQQSHVGAKPSEKLSSEDDLFPGFYVSEKLSTGLADNQIKSNGSAVHDGKSTSGNDELIDAWGDFTSSSNDQPNTWNSSNVTAAAFQEPVKHDPFGEWDVIGSAPNSEALNNAAVGNQSFPDLNVFNADANSQLVGSKSSLHQDSFLAMVNEQNGTADEPSSQPKVPNSFRKEHGDDEAGVFDNLNGSEIASKETMEQKSPVVENLISEMHDLSFMIESSLSIPKTGT